MQRINSITFENTLPAVFRAVSGGKIIDILENSAPRDTPGSYQHYLRCAAGIYYGLYLGVLQQRFYLGSEYQTAFG